MVDRFIKLLMDCPWLMATLLAKVLLTKVTMLSTIKTLPKVPQVVLSKLQLSILALLRNRSKAEVALSWMRVELSRKFSIEFTRIAFGIEKRVPGLPQGINARLLISTREMFSKVSPAGEVHMT